LTLHKLASKIDHIFLIISTFFQINCRHHLTTTPTVVTSILYILYYCNTNWNQSQLH